MTQASDLRHLNDVSAFGRLHWPWDRAESGSTRLPFEHHELMAHPQESEGRDRAGVGIWKAGRSKGSREWPTQLSHGDRKSPTINHFSTR